MKSYSLFVVNETNAAIVAGSKFFFPENAFLRDKKIVQVFCKVIPGRSLGINLEDFSVTFVNQKNENEFYNLPCISLSHQFNLNRRRNFIIENLNTAKSYLKFYDPSFTLGVGKGLWFNFYYE